MALKKIHETPVGAKCAVRIYRNYEWDEYIVKSIINGKVVGGKDGGYFTSDKTDAYGSAAAEAQRLGKRPVCQTTFAAPRRRRRKR
jgi:hypothetical protein